MEENIADTLQTAAGVMHFFGQYRVCNALILLSRLLRVKSVHTLDQLDVFVTREEERAADAADRREEEGMGA